MWCTFGERCIIENGHEFTDFLKFEGFGSAKRCTYFFKLSDGNILVRCGCFCDRINAFREKVVFTHGNSKHAREYLTIAALAENHFKPEENK